MSVWILADCEWRAAASGLRLPRAPGGLETRWLGWQFLNVLIFFENRHHSEYPGLEVIFPPDLRSDNEWSPISEKKIRGENTGRLGAGFISVCLETRWLGQKRGFYVPGCYCIVERYSETLIVIGRICMH